MPTIAENKLRNAKKQKKHWKENQPKKIKEPQKPVKILKSKKD